ncbi:sigma-70 family RNA polymerase sigma factor [Desulfobulbus sp. AH-315-M07]|nr:sigma-70 family RNA polymerase sigma factor [Desulfobulbus sp. AH-315-M07]
MQSVELIYRTGCPNLELAREQLRRAFEDAGLEPRWSELRIDDPESPAHVRELASPTFLVRGVDVCTSRELARSASSTACRVYRCGGGQERPVPAVTRIATKLKALIVAELALETQGPGSTSATTDWNDEALMAGYQRGDVRAFEILFERYQPRLYGYFLRRFVDRELVADLFQRTMLRVHRSRHGYDVSRRFESWAFSIAANLVKDELKLRSRRPGDTSWDEPNEDGAAALSDPERELATHEQRMTLQAAVAALPEAQREVVVLHKLEGRTFREIAYALDEQIEAVKSRAFRGYRNLRAVLSASDPAPPCCT